MALEVFLRTTIYVGKRQNDDAVAEDRHAGPFALFAWYKGLFFEAIGTRLAMSRRNLVAQVVGRADFPALYEQVINNSSVMGRKEADSLIAALNQLLDEYERGRRVAPDPSALQQLDATERFKLGYLILNRLGKKGLMMLLDRGQKARPEGV